jgi:hypothetical protein
MPRQLPGFIRLLKRTPWFLNLGLPNPRDSKVVRIHSWKEWRGPERDWNDWAGYWPTLLRKNLVEMHKDRAKELEALWTSLEDLVVERASRNVPLYDPDEDPWYGPSACVWHAGYFAGLTSWYIVLGLRQPEALVGHWQWYLEGHWPCGYAECPPGYGDESSMEIPLGRLLVY